MAWYQSLSSEERADANRFIGFEHLDLRPYKTLETSQDSEMEKSLVELVQREQRQRLTDFVQQLDLLLEPSEDKENLKFWRGYLGDKVALNSLYPELIPSIDHSQAQEIAQALGILSQQDNSSPQDRAQEIKISTEDVPLLIFFLPVLDNTTLLALSDAGVEITSEATLEGLAEFVGLLKNLTPMVEKVIKTGDREPTEGATELKDHLDSMDFKKTEGGAGTVFRTSAERKRSGHQPGGFGPGRRDPGPSPGARARPP